MEPKRKTGLPVPHRGKPGGSRGTGQNVTVIPATPPRQSQITVHTDQGPIVLEALAWGPLAVHESQGKAGWTVTHVPSGLAILPGLTRERAVQLIADIRERGLDMNWRRLGDCPQATRQILGGLVQEYRGGLSININIEVK